MRDRERYVALELEVIAFGDEDVVCASGEHIDTNWLPIEEGTEG
jgi:hypothetical protein